MPLKLSELNPQAQASLLALSQTQPKSTKDAKSVLQAEVGKLVQSGALDQTQAKAVEDLFDGGNLFKDQKSLGKLQKELAKVSSTSAQDVQRQGMRGGGGTASLAQVQLRTQANTMPAANDLAPGGTIPELAGFSPRVRRAAMRLLARKPGDEVVLNQLRELLPHLKSRGLSDRKCEQLIKQLGQADVTLSYFAKPSDIDEIKSEHAISQTVRKELEQALGQEAQAFFEIFVALRDKALGRGDDSDLVGRMDTAVKQLSAIESPVDGERISPHVINNIHAAKIEMADLLGKIARQGNPDASWNELAVLYRNLICDVAQDRNVFITSRPSSEDGWPQLRAMSDWEKEVAQIKDQDPETYALLLLRRKTYKSIEKAIEKSVADNGMESRQANILGRVVTIGKEPATKEEYVFDYDGDILPLNDYVEKRQNFLDARELLAKVPTKTEVPLKDLRTIDADALGKLKGDIEHVALTDDKAKMGQLTRIYPTMWHQGQRVIVDGRFEGVMLDDLVNAQGRLIEGTSYTFNARLGRGSKGPVRYNPGEREPYVTMATVKERGELKDKLFLQMPFFQGEATEIRQAVRKLSKAIPSIKYKTGSRNTSFYFDAKDFAVVSDALQGLSLSKSSMEHLQNYFEDLAESDIATEGPNLEHYSMQAIGGFKDKLTLADGSEIPARLLSVQKKALAWLEANGNNGVCALDTGVGKTLVAVSMMRKMMRDGYHESKDSNGRFLYVCPPSLRGNLPKEMFRFLEPDAAEDLYKRVDIMSYGQFRSAMRTGKFQGKPWSGDGYTGAFFDEAQAMKSLGSKTTQAALGWDNPHKILLTASPMERNPMEAYVLSAIANNINLKDRVEGKSYRREMRKFKERFCETLGGRILGVKEDPLTRRDLNTWVKRNIFYADKRDVEEFKLPKLTQETEVLNMDKKVEKAYRSAARQISQVMKGMVSMYRDKGLLIEEDGKTKINPLAKDKRIPQMFGIKFRNAIKQLNDLANMPEKIVPGAGYPKLDRAGEILMSKLASSKGASRAVLFSDDKEFVMESARQMSLKVPMKVHAACLNDKIYLYKNGQQLTEFKGHRVPFTPRQYRKDPSQKANMRTNRKYLKNEWQQFVLNELISPNRDVASCSMQGQVYQQGQNLQAFDTVMQLDRDTWCSEDMRQRTARLWRQGQKKPVHEITLDTVYPEARNDFDATLDEIRSHYQVLEGELFDKIIKESQSTELGEEWFGLDKDYASFSRLDEHTLELMLSPYLTRSKPPVFRRADKQQAA
ncbi:MAG: DEAD/DEAH box helicase [Myxococcota bacterium]|nr:DEAD/DEAH box helicase [Myxococcota bacterium]